MFLSHFKVRGVSNQCFVPWFFSWLCLSILLIRIAKHLTMSGSRYSSPMRLPVDFDETLFHPAEPHRPVCGICKSDLGADCYHLSWPFYSSCCGRFLCWDCFYDKSDDDIIVFSPRDDYPDTGCSGHNWTYDHSSQDNSTIFIRTTSTFFLWVVFPGCVPSPTAIGGSSIVTLKLICSLLMRFVSISFLLVSRLERRLVTVIPVLF